MLASTVIHAPSTQQVATLNPKPYSSPKLRQCLIDVSTHHLCKSLRNALLLNRDRTPVALTQYIHIYIYIYIHTYVHTYVHTYIHTYIHTYREGFRVFRATLI